MTLTTMMPSLPPAGARQLALLLCALVAFLLYGSRYLWLAERVVEDEAFLHSLRLRLSAVGGDLANCTALVDSVLASSASAAASNASDAARVVVDRAFIDSCVSQSRDLADTIDTLHRKLTEQTALVLDLHAELKRVREQRDAVAVPAACGADDPQSAQLIQSLQHEVAALRAKQQQQPAAAVALPASLADVVAQRDFLAQQLADRASQAAAHAFADCGHESACDRRIEGETRALVRQCNAQLAIVTGEMARLRNESRAALATGYVPFTDGSLDQLISQNALNGTLYVTAFKYEPPWLLNWWHWLRASGIRTALVFACDEALLRFCDEHDIPAFGAWRLLEPYAMCDRVDRGSGVKVRALIEVLKRGVDVVYSDADVVWRRPFVPPRRASGVPAYDIAFQSYSPLPDNDTDALVQYGTNFGLFHARATRRAVAWLQALLPRVAAHYEFVTAPHWRTPQGLDQVRVYGCNDQNALHEYVAAADTVCQYTFDKHAAPPNAAANGKQCAVVALLSPLRYPTAMPFIYARRDALNDSSLVALHMTTYPGADKTHGARELRLWSADAELGVVGAADRFVMLDAAQLKKLRGDSLDSDVLQPMRRLLAFALAAERVAILPEFSCAQHPLFDSAAGARAKPSRERPYVLSRATCTADLYFELAALANSSVRFLPAAYLARLDSADGTVRKTIDLSSDTLTRATVQRAVEAANDPTIVAWHDFGAAALSVADDLQRRVDAALRLNTFFDFQR
jgi:hypothetical protein